jgi:hypothetical protein
VGWLSAGGTSLSAPQWAGVLTVANAQRALASKSALGAPHAVLYGTVAGTAANYAGAFLDITKGSDGTCSACSAKTGYDNPTGLGTPNVASLLPFLTGASTTATAPVVSSGSISGNVGVALSFAVTTTAADAVSYTLSGAPTGMTIGSGGAVAWATPVAGMYTVTVTATDTTTKLSGQGIYKVTIAAPAPPTVTSASISGTAGVAISYQIAVTSADTMTLTLSGAPSGVALSNAGLLSWSNPVQGTYTATVTAKDTKSGLSGQGSVKLIIAAAVAPVVSGASISGTTGSALSFSVSVTHWHHVAMHIDGVPNRTSRPTYLLRESYREGKKVRKRTIANLSALSDEQIEAIRAVLAGHTVRPVEELWQTTRSRSHGAVQAVRVAMQRLGFESLIASRPSPERDAVCAMVAARILAPHTKLATTRWWHTTTLAEEYGVADRDETDLYAAMDWLLERQADREEARGSPPLGRCARALRLEFELLRRQ